MTTSGHNQFRPFASEKMAAARFAQALSNPAHSVVLPSRLHAASCRVAKKPIYWELTPARRRASLSRATLQPCSWLGLVALGVRAAIRFA